jgi:hypothetical protein
MYFHEWLVRERKLTQKSAKNYSWAVFCYLSKKIGVNLATVDDSSLLDELGKRLFENPEVVEADRSGKGMYKCGLNHYKAYLQERQKGFWVEEKDVKLIRDDSTISATVKETLVMARVGQGKYRNDLMKLWDGKCSVTGYKQPEFLIASHIKPWYVADNVERLDPYNGLLLTPNLDKAFDGGFISFNPRDQGKIVFSPAFVGPADLGISDDLHVRFMTPQLAAYLKYHMGNVFIRERKTRGAKSMAGSPSVTS